MRSLFFGVIAGLSILCVPVTKAAAPCRLEGGQSVTASWYGPGHHGRPTASGEIFDRTALTAAHPCLPFGTWVTVAAVDTGRTVLVRINDRGPFRAGRDIDLSEAAARQLGLMGRGLRRVRLTTTTPVCPSRRPCSGEGHAAR